MEKKGISILYIEDDEVDQISVQREFKKITPPVTVYSVKNGLEALDKLQGNKDTRLNPLPEAILLDINMPKMNGIEFLTALRSNPAFDNILVFIVTSTYSTKDKIAFQNLNVSGCIIKPLHHPDAVNIIWTISAGPQATEVLF